MDSRAWIVESRAVLRTGQDRTGTEQPAKSIGKSKFQNEASPHPTRAATTSHALASHRLTNSPCSELLVLHRKISQLAGLITRWSFLLENRSQRARVLPTVTGGRILCTKPSTPRLRLRKSSWHSCEPCPDAIAFGRHVCCPAICDKWRLMRFESDSQKWMRSKTNSRS